MHYIGTTVLKESIAILLLLSLIKYSLLHQKYLPMSALTTHPVNNRIPEKLVENRTTFAGQDAIFSIYDTYEKAERVELYAPSIMYCGMVTGKKVVHAGNNEVFDFIPGESLVLHPNQTIHIDFPEARLKQPTSCITLEIPVEKIEHVAQRMNEIRPRLGEISKEWKYDLAYKHFTNTKAIELVIGKLSWLFTSNETQKDLLADLNTTELIVHMLQSGSRDFLLQNFKKNASNDGLSAALEYLHSNLTQLKSVDELADKACMSKSSFYRHFKNETGLSPVEYVNKLRVERARKLLQKSGTQVSEVSFQLGFSSVSHFIKLFKKETGITPKQYGTRNLAHSANTVKQQRRHKDAFVIQK